MGAINFFISYTYTIVLPVQNLDAPIDDLYPSDALKNAIIHFTDSSEQYKRVQLGKNDLSPPKIDDYTGNPTQCGTLGVCVMSGP